MNDQDPKSTGLEFEQTSAEALAAWYAVGGLSPEEREEIDARLRSGDPTLAAELAKASDGVALFVTQEWAVPPAPDLKERLMEALLKAEPVGRQKDETWPAVASGATEAGAFMDADADLKALSRYFEQAHQRFPFPPESDRAARKAVLVIDMLHDYVDEHAPMEAPLARAIVPALQELLELERERGTPIFYINDSHPDDDRDFDVWPKHAVRGTAGARVIPQLAPRVQDYQVERVSYSAFFETGLEGMLERMGVTDLVLTGQAADACVLGTAIDALMRGFRVEVPERCVAGLTEEGKIFALRRIGMLKPYQPKKRR